MIVLHIAALKNDPFTGVCVAAPEHIRNQGRYADVALLNIKNCTIEGIENQFIYNGKDWQDVVSTRFKKPDIVVFHEVYHIEFVRIAKSLEKNNIPYIIIPHGCLVKSAQQKKKWKKIIANLLVFKHFICHSEALQCLSDNELKNTGFKVSKFIGTNGVKIPNVVKRSFNKENIHLVYIGRLEVFPKGLDLLLQALKNITDGTDGLSKSISIDIYGPDVKGRYAEVESLIVRNNLSGVVSLHHELMGDEKLRCLLSTDIFIQTSRHEGMPMGILEAMSYGIPCVITEGTSLGDITRKYDAGWVAEVSVPSIAKTIMNAINDSNHFEQKSVNARLLIKDNFSWDVIAKSAIEKYEIIKSNYSSNFV